MLIVEDQDLMRRLLREYVQSAYPGAEILEAENGARALQLCSEERPDVVLMDIALPDANGIDLAAEITWALPQTKVIIVSQHADAVFAERARAAGAHAFVRKDRVYRELLPAIERALADGPKP